MSSSNALLRKCLGLCILNSNHYFYISFLHTFAPPLQKSYFGNHWVEAFNLAIGLVMITGGKADTNVLFVESFPDMRNEQSGTSI